IRHSFSSICSHSLYACPKTTNLNVIYKILHYLKGFSRKDILFERENKLTIKAYIDEVGQIVDRRSTSDIDAILHIIMFKTKEPNMKRLLDTFQGKKGVVKKSFVKS
ncbi:hypothetical protein V2J09_022866, partial [Rumex salicifolius]